MEKERLKELMMLKVSLIDREWHELQELIASKMFKDLDVPTRMLILCVEGCFGSLSQAVICLCRQIGITENDLRGIFQNKDKKNK